MIDREKIADMVNGYFGCDAAYFDVDPFGLADHLISNGVTAVVRCAECRRCFVKETIRHKQPMWICMRDDLNICVHPHDFCSYGKRRSND